MRKLCNFNKDREEMTRLERGVLHVPVEKPYPDPFLPDASTIRMALATDEADEFRKRLEGFVDLCGKNYAQCTLEEYGVHNNLHNAVHIFIGGHMQVVASASNDPVFFLHHANIDRIFETWLQRFNGSPPSFQKYNDSRHPGHNLNDYLVPFFQLKTNADKYKLSDKLGFRYDSWPWSPNYVSKCSVEIDQLWCMKEGYHGMRENSSQAQSMYQVPLLLVFLAVTTAFLMLAS